MCEDVDEDHDADDEATGDHEGLFVGVSLLCIVKDDVVGEHRSETEELGVERRHDGGENSGSDESDHDGVFHEHADCF